MKRQLIATLILITGFTSTACDQIQVRNSNLEDKPQPTTVAKPAPVAQPAINTNPTFDDVAQATLASNPQALAMYNDRPGTSRELAKSACEALESGASPEELSATVLATSESTDEATAKSAITGVGIAYFCPKQLEKFN